MADVKRSERRGLGRGLSALMADVEPDLTSETAGKHLGQRVLPIEQINPNPEQPRKTFAEEALNDLADSIREKGVIQPLVVRPSPKTDGSYEIVAGERRWRAAQKAKLHELPVVVRDFDDSEVLEIAIIENIQRADLNPMEEASGYRQLMDSFGHTQEKVSQALGKSRSHIANSLRLLTLPIEVQDMLQKGQLSAGHARTLVTAQDPIGLAKEIVKKGLSVRAAERLAKRAGVNKIKKTIKQTGEKSADTRALEADLTAAIGLKVNIDHDDSIGGGSVTIAYRTLEDLDDLCARFSAT
jgi:ParB family chromosome partitioning protein